MLLCRTVGWRARRRRRSLLPSAAGSWAAATTMAKTMTRMVIALQRRHRWKGSKMTRKRPSRGSSTPTISIAVAFVSLGGCSTLASAWSPAASRSMSVLYGLHGLHAWPSFTDNHEVMTNPRCADIQMSRASGIVLLILAVRARCKVFITWYIVPSRITNAMDSVSCIAAAC